jgi:predicted MFS family arabinose efflux permease
MDRSTGVDEATAAADGQEPAAAADDGRWNRGDPSPRRFARDRITWLAYGLLAYFAYLQASLGPLMPFLRDELGIDYGTAGLHFAAFALGSVVVGVLGNPAARRWGRRPALWIGAAGMAPGVALLVLGRDPVWTVAGAAVMGLFGAAVLVTDQAVLADHHRRWRGVALAEANVAASVATILASTAVGAAERTGLGWRAAVLLPLLVPALLAARWGRVPFPEARRPRSAAGDAGRGRLPAAFWAYWAVLFLGIAAEWSVGLWGSEFLASGVGLTRADAASALGVFFAAMVAGRVLGSRLARRASVALLLPGSLLVALAGFPLFWLGPTPGLAVVGLAVFGLGIANVYPLGVAAATGAAPDLADAASARLAIAGGGAGLSAPLALGWLADRFGIGPAFGIAPVLLAGGLAAALVARRVGGAPGAT